MELLDVLTRLGVAALLAAVVGIDRELRSKAAGLRTNIVVGTATAAFAAVGSEVGIGASATDATRVAAQVVSGIGFLGGGAIFASGGKPTGLTTAAALWGSAAIGVAAGLQQYMVAGVLVAVLLFVLWPLDQLVERRLQARARRDVRIQVILEDLEAVSRVQQRVLDGGLRIVEFKLEEVVGQPVLDLRLLATRARLTATVPSLRTIEGVGAVLDEEPASQDV